MYKASVTKSIDVAAEAAWEVLSSFRNIEEISPIHKSITSGQGKGATRSCFMPDGAEIKEELTAFNTSEMQFEYVILSGPFPVENYVSTVSIKAQGKQQCAVHWSTSFDSVPEVADDMKALFEGFYNVIIESLEKKLLAVG